MTLLWSIEDGILQRRGYTAYARPSGPGYVRYEDLYQSGDTISQAMARLSSSSPNANSDGTAYITFPEGVFTFSDFKAAGSTVYGIYVPTNCKGIIGSGPGTLGSTATGTIFTMTPGSWTGSSPLQSTGSANPNCMIFRGPGTATSVPILFSQFQVAGTTQGDTDGKCYNGLEIFNPESPVTVQDLLITGWYGDAGSPPGETFGLVVHGPNGPHKVYRVEADGRRQPGGIAYGAVGITLENQYAGELHNCSSHHGRTSSIVFYQTFNCQTFNCIAGPQDYSQYVSSNQGVNHERTSGTVHNNLTMHASVTNRLVNMTHSNGTETFTYDGQSCSTVNGSLTVINPTFEPIYSDNYFYIQSWVPYDNGDTMTTAPLVTQSDGTTHLTYEWVHSTHQLIT